MSRNSTTELGCDECGHVIDHVILGVDYSAHIRRLGGVVSKHGDFCSKECFEARKRFIKEHGV